MPNFKGPAEIIDINDTNAKVEIGDKIKLLSVKKLKLFLQEHANENDTELQDLQFHDAHTDGPITRTHAKLIKNKEAATLALLILNEEGENEADIDSLCDSPCPACDAKDDYFKNNPHDRK